MARRKKERKLAEALIDTVPTNPWQIYLDLFTAITDEDDAPVLVPVFPCESFVPGNVGTLPAKSSARFGGRRNARRR